MPQKAKVIFLSLFILLGFWGLRHFFLWNITDSMPRGLYLISPQKHFHRGDIVGVCLSLPLQQFGVSRGYLLSQSRCGLSEVLVKKIIAIPGDTVVLKNDVLTVNGYTYPYSTLSRDTKNRLLISVPRGAYANTKGYWVVGTHDKKSWDSRYWGAVSASQLIFKLRPILTF